MSLKTYTFFRTNNRTWRNRFDGRVEDIKYHLNRIDQLTLIVDENREVPEVNMAKLLQQEFKNSTLIENLVSENARLLRGFVEGFSEHYI